MPYNAMAESYAQGRTPSVKPWPYTTPTGWCRFNDVYSDIADVTPTDAPFRAAKLAGKLPCLQQLAMKSQREIIAVVVRDMQTLPVEADGLTKVMPGVYQWRPSIEA